MVTLATAACQPDTAFDIGIPSARPIGYDSIRQASGVLGYAEPLLGPALATRYQVPVGPGASAVDAAVVAGAWELPLDTRVPDMAAALRARGVLDRVRDQADGQLWIADYRPHGREAVRLLLINGTHPAFATNAVPAVRPGQHVYLIAYRLP